MGESAEPWKNLDLPERKAKPRTEGLTFVSDVGFSCQELRGILEDYHSMVDFAKLGVGTAYVLPKLTEKLEIYREYDIEPYFGGTLFEKFYSQGMLDEYCAFLKDNGIEWIEVSSGTIDLSLEERCEIVEKVVNDFGVIAEVGCKDTETVMSPLSWIEELNSLIKVGAKFVVTEGRDSGSAGIFRPSGELREGLIADILSSVDNSKLVFEAPTPSSQMYFINLCTNCVNLGNISLKDLLLLETQRRALRYETFHIS